MPRRAAIPFFPFEARARAKGYRRIAGIDEAGRGPLAGPVVAAAVMLPATATLIGLQDSKQLTGQQREAIYRQILRSACAYGLGIVSPMQIDRDNILGATKDAMWQAVQGLGSVPDLLLIDGTASLPYPLMQWTLVQGDARCASIAAASVVAKVTRDRLMVAYAKRYPGYGFETHKGYPTREHYRRLHMHGPCVIHRRSFRGVLGQTHD